MNNNSENRIKTKCPLESFFLSFKNCILKCINNIRCCCIISKKKEIENKVNEESNKSTQLQNNINSDIKLYLEKIENQNKNLDDKLNLINERLNISESNYKKMLNKNNIEEEFICITPKMNENE